MEMSNRVSYKGHRIDEMTREEMRVAVLELGRLWQQVEEELRQCEKAFRDVDVLAYIDWRAR